MLYAPAPFKRCTRCDEFKPATTEWFYVDKRHKDGLQSWCRVCICEYSLRRAKENPEKKRESDHRQAKKHPEKKRETARRYRENNIDKVRENDRIAHRRHRQNNPDKMREYDRQRYQKDPSKKRNSSRHWRETHPEERRNQHRRRKTTKRQLPATFTDKDWRTALEYFHGTCAYCGNGPSLFDQYYAIQQDHFIPLTKGGGYTPDNIIPACQTCNFNKKDSDASEWAARRFGKHKAKVMLARIATYFELIKAKD